MCYRNFCLAITLVPVLLFAGAYRERIKQVDLVVSAPNPNDQDMVEAGPLQGLREVLKLKQTTLKVTDLAGEKDSAELSYVVVWDKPEYLTDQTLARFPQKKVILYMWQSSVYDARYIAQFKRVYTWNDDLVDNKKFFKFYYPALQPMQTDLPSFESRKLLTQTVGAHDLLKQYKFAVCYEDMHDVKGYVTEKIFNCFAAGTIPIYWGASNITDYIPKECFIDRRDFKDFEAVMDYIQGADAQAYINNIKAFLESDQAKLFSKELFDVIFLESIRFP
jgi:hypothetical protein